MFPIRVLVDRAVSAQNQDRCVFPTISPPLRLNIRFSEVTRLVALWLGFFRSCFLDKQVFSLLPF